MSNFDKFVRELERDPIERAALDEARARLSTNRERSAAEVAEFKADPPTHYFAYHEAREFVTDRIHNEVGSEITTWMGDTLATVTWRHRPWRSNMGDERQAFDALGINGVQYYGVAYLSAGGYVRMTRRRHQP